MLGGWSPIHAHDYDFASCPMPRAEPPHLKEVGRKSLDLLRAFRLKRLESAPDLAQTQFSTTHPSDTADEESSAASSRLSKLEV